MYRIAVLSISSLGPFCWRVLSDCAVTWVPYVWLNSDRPTWEIIWKKKILRLIFTFYLNTDASVIKIFPVVVQLLYFNKKTAIIHEVGVDPFT